MGLDPISKWGSTLFKMGFGPILRHLLKWVKTLFRDPQGLLTEVAMGRVSGVLDLEVVVVLIVLLAFSLEIQLGREVCETAGFARVGIAFWKSGWVWRLVTD